MTTWTRWTRLALLAGCLAAAPAVHADVTGSFDGALSAKKLATPIAAAAALSQTGKRLLGTIVLGGEPFGGVFLVQGRATPKRIKASGVGNGLTLRWQGKIAGDTVKGQASVKGAAGKTTGRLTLLRNVSTGDGAGCDAVFTQNETLFVDSVLGTALLACPACHTPGGQGGATRLHVTPSDPLATARQIALLIDFASPDASRILQKPLGLVPHGGLQAIIPGSPEEQFLRDWVALVAPTGCN